MNLMKRLITSVTIITLVCVASAWAAQASFSCTSGQYTNLGQCVSDCQSGGKQSCEEICKACVSTDEQASPASDEVELAAQLKRQNDLLEEQNKKLADQSNLLSQIISMLQTFFGIFGSPQPTPTQGMPTQGTGSIEVSSSPLGAEVYLDNHYKGTTPVTIPEVPLGDHSVELRLSGYKTWSSSGSVNEGDSIKIFAALERISTSVSAPLPTTVPTTPPITTLPASIQGTGSIFVASTPSFSDVYIDSKFYGRTPDTFNNIPMGTHTITVSSSGYQDWSFETTINAGVTQKFSGKLIPVQTTVPTTNVPTGYILLDRIGDKHVGDTFRITGTTNLNEWTTLIVNIQGPQGNSPADGVVAVVNGGFSFDVDASRFTPGTYRVTVQGAQEPGVEAASTFMVLPTPTTIPTTIPTVIPTTYKKCVRDPTYPSNYIGLVEIRAPPGSHRKIHGPWGFFSLISARGNFNGGYDFATVPWIPIEGDQECVMVDGCWDMPFTAYVLRPDGSIYTQDFRLGRDHWDPTVGVCYVTVDAR
jgi:hypothetical protein